MSEKLTRPSGQWLFLTLTVGIAVTVALSMTFAADADAKKKGHKKHRNQSSLAVPTPTPTPSPSPEPPPPSPEPPPPPSPPQQQPPPSNPQVRAHVQAREIPDISPGNSSTIKSMEGWLTIHHPTVDSRSKDWSLAELNIGNYNLPIPNSNGEHYGATNKGRGTIEVGWMVDSAPRPDGYGDSDPHLFVVVRGGFDARAKYVTDTDPNGFHPTRNDNNQFDILKPGDNLKTKILDDGRPVDRGLVDNGPVRVAIEYHQADSTYNEGWYIWFANFYIGYIDPSWFTTGLNIRSIYPLTAASNVSWYGEVGSLRPIPCSAMGNGTYGTQVGSARIENMQVNSQPSTPTFIQPVYEQYWNGRLVNNVLYYGGPNPCF